MGKVNKINKRNHTKKQEFSKKNYLEETLNGEFEVLDRQISTKDPFVHRVPAAGST